MLLTCRTSCSVRRITVTTADPEAFAVEVTVQHLAARFRRLIRRSVHDQERKRHLWEFLLQALVGPDHGRHVFVGCVSFAMSGSSFIARTTARSRENSSFFR